MALLFCLLAVAGVPAALPSAEEACRAPDDCVAALVACIHSRSEAEGAKARELSIRRRLLTFGRPGLDAVAPLLDDVDPAVAVAAANAIGVYGTGANVLAPQLRRVAGYRDGEVAAAVEQALSAVGAPGGVKNLLVALHSPPPGTIEPDTTLRRLIHIGAAAHDATPVLVDDARHAPWEKRWLFVEALAWIADARAVPFLTEALDVPDWRVTVAAERALGRLGSSAISALPALSRVAATHWLPRARRLAEEARASIAIEPGRAVPATGYFATMRPELYHDALNSPPVEGGCRPYTHQASDGWKLRQEFGTEKMPAGLSMSRYGAIGRYVVETVGDGQLVGSDRGEFGGELVWLSGGQEQIIKRGRVFAIARRPWGLLLLSSSGSPDATLSVVRRESGRQWNVQPRIELPAAPVALKLKPDGGMAVATARMGTLVLSAAGLVDRYECQ